jgi:acyl-CoA dehydrogenase
VGFTLRNLINAIWHNLSGGRFVAAPAGLPVSHYYQQLTRTSATFAFVADLAMMVLGGELKRSEKLSARLGDILSEMYLQSCTLKRFEDDGCPIEDLPLVDWNCQTSLYDIQMRFDEILANFPSRPLGWLLRAVVFPLGMRRKRPSDALGRQCAEVLLVPSEARDRLTAGIFSNRDPDDLTGCLEYALEIVLEAEKVERKLKAIRFDGTLEQAVASRLISESEAKLVAEAERATRKVIMVDDFPADQLGRDSMPGAGSKETGTNRAEPGSSSARAVRSAG